MYCSSCGKGIPDGSAFCPECGTQLNGTMPSTQQEYRQSQSSAQGTRDQTRTDLIYPKNPPVSPHVSLLALIQPGIPHVIYGQVAKGLLLTVAFWLSIPTGIGPLIILVGALVDAYKIGNALKLGRTVGKWQVFP